MDSRGTRNGSAAAIVTRVVTTIKTKGITFTSSYEEEAAVMESALSWTFTNANHQSIILLICIDSESLCEAFISSHPWTFSIHNSIISISSSIFIQWILVYYAIPGNDIANKAAKKTTSIATNRILPTSLSSSIQVINDTISDTPPTHERVDSIYQRLTGFPRCKTYKQQKRWRSPCSSTIRPSLFSQAIPPPTWSFKRSDLLELSRIRTRSPSLALRISDFNDHETTSVWVPSRVLRINCQNMRKSENIGDIVLATVW